MRQFGRLCTKTHRIRGLWYDTVLSARVRLEANFVVVGYGNECRLPFRTPGYDGVEGTEWRDRPWST